MNALYSNGIMNMPCGNNEPELRRQIEDLKHTVAVLKAALLESEDKFRALTDSAPVGIFLNDAQGRAIYINKKCAKLVGVPAEEALHFDWISSLHPDDRERMVSEWKKSFENSVEFHSEYRWVHKDGKVVWTLGEVVPLLGKDGIASVFIGTLTDITALKEAEREREVLQTQLSQAQNMEAIGTLAGGIAHDFNNILGAILGYAQMAYEDSLSNSVKPSHLNKVLQAGYRAKDLVKQILAFSRQSDTKRILLDPSCIIKEAVKLLRPILPSTITITQDIGTATKSIFADPTQIHQVVMNLCTNAFHAMEQAGGILDISLTDCELSLDDLQSFPGVKPGKFVVLSIGDSGPGIPPNILSKIFDPYFTTKEIGKGTGMGLAIVHGIVTNSGGFVSCKSESGKGTVFQVIFPAIERENPTSTEEDEHIPTGKERILLIDDEHMLVEMGQSMLERLGYEVTVRTSSLEALTLFQNRPDQFDVIITDQTMPGMTGVDLARRMLHVRPSVSIILCTGYSNLVDEELARSSGIKGFIMKPMTKKDISKLLRKVLGDKVQA